MLNLEGKTHAELIAMVRNLQASSQAKLKCKVSEKGAVSVYGMGKWPVTLYLSQWESLIAFVKAGHVEQFIEANRSELSVKE